MKIEMPIYSNKTKQFVQKEIVRILKLNNSDFLYELCGLYGKALAKEYTIKINTSKSAKK